MLAKREIVEGAAMLGGSVAGGLMAQATNLGVPYLLRMCVLVATFALAYALMRDIGFTPSRDKSLIEDVRGILRSSIAHGLGHPPVRWAMLEAPFTGGVMIRIVHYCSQIGRGGGGNSLRNWLAALDDFRN